MQSRTIRIRGLRADTEAREISLTKVIEKKEVVWEGKS